MEMVWLRHRGYYLRESGLRELPLEARIRLDRPNGKQT